MPRALLMMLALVAASPLPARSEERPAAEAFRRARRLFKARRYVRAIAAFEQAHRERPHFLVMCSIARCYENLNDMVRAARHYRRCLDDGARQTRLARLITASLAAVQGQVSWLTVSSPGEGGTVIINGAKVGPAPGRYPVNPGHHVVEVRRPGARAVSKTVVTLGGEEGPVRLAPLELTPVTTATSGPRPDGSRPPRDWRGVHQAWFWVTTAATAALASATAVMGARTLQRRAAYEGNPTKGAYDSFNRHRQLTNIFIAATATAGSAGVVLSLFTDFRGERGAGSEARVAGLVVRGRF